MVVRLGGIRSIFLLACVVGLAAASGPRHVPTTASEHSSALNSRFDIVIFMALLLLLLCASLLLIPYKIEQTARLAALLVGASLGAAIY